MITVFPTANPVADATLNVFAPHGTYESVIAVEDPVVEVLDDPAADKNVRAVPVARITVPGPAPRNTTPPVDHDKLPVHVYVPAFKYTAPRNPFVSAVIPATALIAF
jgi:hypothetical protein